jgi:phosphate transport system permease protein
LEGLDVKQHQSIDLPASIRLKGKKLTKSKREETVALWWVRFSAFLMILAAVSITLFLCVKGLQAFVIDHVSITQFLFGSKWSPANTPANYGALVFIFGSFAVTFLAAPTAAPIGIGSALFMTEISKRYGRKFIQPVLEILVGIPSVVYGFIGLVVLVPFFRTHVGGIGFGLFAGAVVVGVMILPTVTSISADALQTVPESMRDAAAALGATRWQTIWKVVIPAALPSLLTAIILGMARAFGEALAVQMVIGNTPQFPKSLTDPTGTLTTQITLSMGETPAGSVFNHVLWSMGLILLVMSYVFIILIRFLSARRKFK